MNRHELEARLKQVRQEKDRINQEGEMMAAHLRERTAEMQEKNAADKEKAKAQKEALNRQRSTVWGKTRLFFGFRDAAARGDSLGDGIGLFFGAAESLFTAAALGPKAEQMQARLTELEQEEGRLLDELERLGPQQKKEQTKAEQRDKIYEEMAQRKAEWERVRSRETDQERLIRLKNIFDDAEARDEEKLRKLL